MAVSRHHLLPMIDCQLWSLMQKLQTNQVFQSKGSRTSISFHFCCCCPNESSALQLEASNVRTFSVQETTRLFSLQRCRKTGGKRALNAFNFNGLASLLSFPPPLPARREQKISETRLGNERAPREERTGAGIFLNKCLMRYHLNKVP